MAKKKRIEEAEDVNLVPIMNLVTILIPFLLMAVQFVSLAVIDSTLPALGEPIPQDPTDEKPLGLNVAVTDEGYMVSGTSDLLQGEEGGEGPAGVTIPCEVAGCPNPESYNIRELRNLLNDVKDEYENEENVILVPQSQISYEVLVITMDATREDPDRQVDSKPRLLFPYVVIAGGVK